MKYLFLITLAIFIFSCHAFTQVVPGFRDSLSGFMIDSASKIKISSIRISGNKRTKTYIIQRELHFKTGDSIYAGELYKNLLRARNQVYNTTLFSDVTINPGFISSTEINVDVDVKEKWYIYPTPQFQLVDRNFNEWIKVYKADLDRVIYGVKFIHYNLSGRRDYLRIFLLNGYARNISFSYTAPYSNSALNEGFGAFGGFTQNREISFRTSKNNKLLQFKNGDFVRNNVQLGASYISRKGFFKRHIYTLGYVHTTVNDSILQPQYNPAYFNSTNNAQDYPEASYIFQYANTNNINYPLTGKVYGLGILKRGAGFTGNINMLMIDGLYSKFFDHGREWYSNIQFNGKIKAPFKLAYINQKALGYGELYLRGLEYYVIDGVAVALTKLTIKKKLISFNIPVPIKNKIVPSIPFTIFAKSFADAGYSYNRKELDTRLNNRLLYTGGVGIDILSLYDMNLGIDYSFNQLGEKGLFLHVKGGF